MNGGSPQGTVLGVICFLIQMNDLRALPQIPLENTITPPGIKYPSISAKFIDDLTVATAVKLKENLEKVDNLDKPLTYHNRTNHILPNDRNPMKTQLDSVLQFSVLNEMKINKDKTKIMLFNRSRSYDFQPSLFIDNNLLSVVEETKLLGVIISSDLKWSKNVTYMKDKCFKNLWMIRRMKETGATINEMKEVYIRQIRSITEIGCPIWNRSLTEKDKTKIEKIQKTTLRVILGQAYISYEKALKTLNLNKLEERRKQICKKFARKSERSEKFSKWFIPAERRTKSGNKFIVPNTRTRTYQKSPLMYLAHLLNTK